MRYFGAGCASARGSIQTLVVSEAMRAGYIPPYLLLGMLAPLLVTSLWVGDCSDTKHLEPEPSAAGSVVEDKSPDGLLLARVVTADEPGNYMLLVEEIASGKTIAHSSLSDPVGSHSHLVQIRWEMGNHTVTAIIDHDFGVGNMEFGLEP